MEPVKLFQYNTLSALMAKGLCEGFIYDWRTLGTRRWGWDNDSIDGELIVTRW